MSRFRILCCTVVMTAAAFAPVPAKASSADCAGRPHETLVADHATGGTLAAGASACFLIAVGPSAPALEVLLTEPTAGEVELGLSLRFAQAASATTHDCRAVTSTRGATCSMHLPKVGDWFVMIDAAEAGAFRLEASVGGCAPLAPASPRAVSIEQGTTQCFTVEVAPDTGGVRVRHGQQPWLVATWLRPAGTPREQSPPCTSRCMARWPEPGRWILEIEAYGRSGTIHSFDLLAEFLPPACTSLPVGTVAPVEVDAVCYAFDIPADAELLRIRSGLNGVVSADANATQPICTFSDTRGRRCAFPGPGGRIHFTPTTTGSHTSSTIETMLEQAMGVSGATTGTFETVLEGALYRFDGPETPAAIVLAGGSDMDLWVRRGAPPTPFEADCVSSHPGGPPVQPFPQALEVYSGGETCALESGEGPIYAFVRFSSRTVVSMNVVIRYVFTYVTDFVLARVPV